MATEQELREALCEVGRRCWARGHVAANDGNFSFRLDEERILCTPTMVSKGYMRPDELAVAAIRDGHQISGPRRLTSEIRLHLHLYRNRPDIRSVIHAHPPHATALTLALDEVPRWIMPEAEWNMGLLPIAPYATPGTDEFAHALDPWIEDHEAFLLRNHGAVTTGADPFDAYYRMEVVDQYCRIVMLALQFGPLREIPEGARQELLEMKRAAGLPDRRYGSTPPASDRRFTPLTGPLVDSPKPSTLARSG